MAPGHKNRLSYDQERSLRYRPRPVVFIKGHSPKDFVESCFGSLQHAAARSIPIQ